MRLTLRTLLAYMDGLLETKDSQEIGKKIEDSQFAKDLFHKIRDVMRRLRLAAPPLTERGKNLDCNTVAEYLDNELPADRLPDFEEVCLKSEMHLAEVASCHQILTMVLGEPAEIDPQSRQRMYQLPAISNRGDEERQAAVEAVNMLSGDGNSAAVPSLPPKVRPRPVVPEYLREPPKKSRFLLAVAIMLFVGATIGLLLLASGQLNRQAPLGKAWQWVQAKVQGKAVDEEDLDEHVFKKPGDASSEAAVPSADSASIPAASGSAASSLANDSGQPPASADKMEAPVPDAEGSGQKSGPGKPPVAVPKAGEVSALPSPAAGTAVPAAASPSEGVMPKSVAPAVGPALGPAVAGAPRPATVAAPKSTGPVVEGTQPKTVAAGPVAATPLKAPVEVASAQPAVVPKPDIAPREAAPPNASPNEDKTRLGRFMSDGQDVLLKLEANQVGWRRVLPEEFLPGQQPLLALPSYRPRVVVLNVGALLELVNGTRIELLADNAHSRPGIDVDFGRVVVKPFAQAGVRLRVVVGAHTGTVTLTTMESIAALEVTRVHDPGQDPEKAISHALTRLYVARGAAVWEEGDKPPAQLTAPAELLLDSPVADTRSKAEKDVPKWITANTVNELDQRAAASVSQALAADRDASVGLMELAEARRKEIRWLADRCLGYLGQFDPMTAALSDLDFSREWPDYIDQLKEAIARGPETAQAVRQSLEKQYGNDAPALYRMLWGYTDKDLEDGEDARLVKFLDHEVPVFRVLAFENLRRITQKSLYYHPEASAAKRLPAVQQWRRQQQAGRIRFNVTDEKPRNAPLTPPARVPGPLKPSEGGAAAEVNPTSAVEPIAPRSAVPANLSTPPTAAGGPRPRGQSPVAFPEPAMPEKHPAVAFPEP